VRLERECCNGWGIGIEEAFYLKEATRKENLFGCTKQVKQGVRVTLQAGAPSPEKREGLAPDVVGMNVGDAGSGI